MDPRNIGAWIGRLLLSTALAAGIFLGTAGVANASESPQDISSVTTTSEDSGAATTQMDPGWT